MGREGDRSGHTPKTRIVLADDNEEILGEIQKLLQPEFEIAGLVHEAASLVDAVFALKPDIVVSDLNMNGSSGIDMGHSIIQRRLCDAVVILTMYNEPGLIQRALRMGIRGYVLKVDAGDELVAALDAVLAGKEYLSRGVVASGRYRRAQDESSPGG